VNEIMNQLRYQMDEAVQTGEPRTRENEEGIAKCTRSLRSIHQAQKRFMSSR
jgi:hypothetical protein